MAASIKYEIKANELSSSSSSSDDSDCDDIFSGSQSTSQTSSSELTKASGKQQQSKSIQRLPTRRPDPNVSNRNALLARENRRKKKAYVEALEKELAEMKNSNKNLHKLLRKQTKMVKKLENEKQYYKGLISNQSDILNLVSVLNTKVPALEMFMPAKTLACSPTDSSRSASSVDPSVSTHSYDFNDNGTAASFDMQSVQFDDFLNDFDFFTDSNYEPYIESNWDQLLGMNDGLLPEEESGFCPTNSPNYELPSNVAGEHNYFNSQDDATNDENRRLCLHIANNTSENVENYCTCHMNANSKHCSHKLPEDLLVVD